MSNSSVHNILCARLFFRCCWSSGKENVGVNENSLGI